MTIAFAALDDPGLYQRMPEQTDNRREADE